MDEEQPCFACGKPVNTLLSEAKAIHDEEGEWWHSECYEEVCWDTPEDCVPTNP